jgi:hypothetical protein
MLVHSSIMNGCLDPEGVLARRMIPAEPQKSVETTTRKPLFLFLLSGLFLLRYEQRALSD